MKNVKVVNSSVVAVSLIEKLRKRKEQIERMRLGDLNRELVKEWQRLKLIERTVMGK